MKYLRKMEVSTNSINHKDSAIINSKKKNGIKKLKQTININKSNINYFLNQISVKNGDRPIQFQTQRNYPQKERELGKQILAKKIDFSSNNLLSKKIIKVISSKNSEQNKNSTLNTSKLSNKQYTNIESKNKISPFHIDGLNASSSINNIVSSLITRNKVLKRNSFQDLKNKSTFNNNKKNSNNIKKNKFINFNKAINNSEINNSILHSNDGYFKNISNNLKNINNTSISTNLTNIINPNLTIIRNNNS